MCFFVVGVTLYIEIDSNSEMRLEDANLQNVERTKKSRIQFINSYLSLEIKQKKIQKSKNLKN